MPLIVERGTCPQEGVGKPDYSREVSSALQRSGAKAKYRQQFKLFALLLSDTASLFPWIQSPIAPGATIHLIDQETGLAMPYIVGAGYTLSMICRGAGLNQDYRYEVFLDGELAMSGDFEGGAHFYEEEPTKFSTELIDPTASSPHSVDAVFTNLGGADMYGGIRSFLILEAVGTPPFPTTKTTKCPFCGNEEVKPVTAIKIICSACGRLYIVYDLTGLKEMP